MPRKLRRPKERRGQLDIPEALFSYAVWGNHRAADALVQIENTDPDDLLALIYFDELPKIWPHIEADALDEFTEHYPGQRPAAWWRFSAPECRRASGRFDRVLGVGPCWPTGVPYLVPLGEVLVESTPAYLDRLGLWLAGERARVSPDAFAPLAFSDAPTSNTPRIPDAVLRSIQERAAECGVVVDWTDWS